MVEGGKGPGSTVGISYANRALGSADTVSLAAWIKKKLVYQKTGAAAGGGGVRYETNEEGHETLIGGRREATVSRRDRAPMNTHSVDQRPAFGLAGRPASHLQLI